MLIGFTLTLAVLAAAAGFLGVSPLPAAFTFAVAALLAGEAAANGVKRVDARGLPVLARGTGVAAAVLLALAALDAPAPVFAPALASFILGASAFTAAWRLPVARRTVAALATLPLLAAAVQLARAADHVPGGAWRLLALWTAGVATILGTTLARGTLARRDADAARRWRAFTESEVKNLLVVIPVTAVLLYRGVLADVVQYIEIYEWALGLAIAFYAVAALRARFRDDAAEDPWSLDAHRHAPDVEPRPDPALAEASDVFAAFVDEGRGRGAYVAFWQRALARVGVTAEDAERLLARVPPEEDGRAWFRGERGPADASDLRRTAHRALLARAIGELEKRSRQDDGSESPPFVQSHH